MMTRQVARQFCRLGEVHSLVYGRRASGKYGRKLAASTRVDSKSRLMNYLGLMHQLINLDNGKKYRKDDYQDDPAHNEDHYGFE